ncbi:hypothetical protein HDV00_006588 [Rhizophlyctis rosea]|nr:hypothetical protein HDV00_006588 [Rhizophlyctis rosea]
MQIWKPKLLEAYPAGCLPELVGHETWRDVATLWWAWNRRWTPRRGGKEDVKVLIVGETLTRTGGGVVRDLIWADSRPVDGYGYANGVRPDGQVMYSLLSSRGKGCGLHDTVFSESSGSLRKYADLSSGEYERTSIVARTMKDGRHRSLRFEDWTSGDLVMIMDLECYQRDIDVVRICQSRAHLSESRPDGLYFHIVSLVNPSSRFTHRAMQFITFDFNGTILAHISRDEATDVYLLTLIRLEDQHIVASRPIPPDISPIGQHLKITRFNIFLHARLRFSIFDFNADLIQILDLSSFLPVDVDNLNFFEERMVFKKLYNSEDDDLSWSWVELIVVDPKTRKVRHHTVDENDVMTGYCFAINEYPVDGVGRRTGAPGTTRLFHRPMVKIEVGEEGIV